MASCASLCTFLGKVLDRLLSMFQPSGVLCVLGFAIPPCVSATIPPHRGAARLQVSRTCAISPRAPCLSRCTGRCSHLLGDSRALAIGPEAFPDFAPAPGGQVPVEDGCERHAYKQGFAHGSGTAYANSGGSMCLQIAVSARVPKPLLVAPRSWGILVRISHVQWLGSNTTLAHS